MVAACRDWGVGSTNPAAQPFDDPSSEFSLIGAGATASLPTAPFEHRSLLAYARTNIIGPKGCRGVVADGLRKCVLQPLIVTPRRQP
jgi:hypothetical protein